MYIPSYNEVINLIVQRIPYIDSVAVWLPRILEDYEKDTLESLCGSLIVPYKPKPMRYHPEWQCRITLHQPKTEALKYLHEITGGTSLINHVALALDLTTRTFLDAKVVGDFFRRHQTKRGRGNQKTGECKNTNYSSSEIWVNNNIARYPDKPSKVTGDPCCHIEWRINTADPVRSHGINSVLDLIDFDHYGFWKKNMRLHELEIEKIGKRVLKRTRMRRPLMISYRRLGTFNRFMRVGHMVARSCQRSGSSIGYSVQDVIDNEQCVDRRSIKKLSTAPFLPPRRRHKL